MVLVKGKKKDNWFYEAFRNKCQLNYGVLQVIKYLYILTWKR